MRLSETWIVELYHEKREEKLLDVWRLFAKQNQKNRRYTLRWRPAIAGQQIGAGWTEADKVAQWISA